MFRSKERPSHPTHALRTAGLVFGLAAASGAVGGCDYGGGREGGWTDDRANASVGTVYVLSASKYADDPKLANDLEIALETFQGCVNRHAPHLYIVHKWKMNKDEDPRLVDQLWFDDLEADSGIELVEVGVGLNKEAKVAAVLNHPDLKSHCDKTVLYASKKSRLAVNNAITAAGIHRAYVLDKNARSTLEGAGVTLNIVADYSKKNWRVDPPAGATKAQKAEAETKSALKAMRWGNDHLLGKSGLSTDRIGMLTGHYRSESSEDKSPKVDVMGIDLMVSEGMFVTMVDASGAILDGGGNTPELNEVFRGGRYDGGLAFGWWSAEKEDLKYLGRKGVATLGRGNNLSFWQHIEQGIRPQKEKANVPVYKPNKVYIALSTSQGDAMGFVQQDNRRHVEAKVGGQRVVESVDFGLMHNALQDEYAPYLAHWMYQNVTKSQSFMSKGFGYPSVSSMQKHGKLDAWVASSVPYMQSIDSVDMMIADNKIDTANGKAALERIAQELYIRAIFTKNSTIDNANKPEATEAYMLEGTAVFEDPVWGLENDDGSIKINKTVAAIEASADKRQFFWVFFRHRAPTADVKKIYDRLDENDDVVLVSPDQLIRIFLEQN